MTPIEKLLKQRAILKSYLLAKLDVEDWHGIRDCCVDIEVCGVHIDGGMAEYLMVPSHTLVHGEALGFDGLALV